LFSVICFFCVFKNYCCFASKLGEGVYSFSKSSAYAEKCYLENKNNWPTAQQMNLDASQYEAVQLALENKLALIQGF
jgi:hypothetical protein